MQSLVELDLCDCERLKRLPALPQGLKSLRINWCEALAEVSTRCN
jgi:hypothetical protein